METVNEIIQWISNNILTVEPTAILDIAIIAFIIYKLMMLLRRTSSGNVVKGIIVVVVAMGVARLLHLYAQRKPPGQAHLLTGAQDQCVRQLQELLNGRGIIERDDEKAEHDAADLFEPFSIHEKTTLSQAISSADHAYGAQKAEEICRLRIAKVD